MEVRCECGSSNRSEVKVAPLDDAPLTFPQGYERLNTLAEVPHQHCSVRAVRSRGISYFLETYDLEAIAEGGEAQLDAMLRALFVEGFVALRMRHPSFHCLCDMSVSTDDSGMFGCLVYENRGASSLNNLLDSDSPVIDLDSMKCIIYMLCYAVSTLHSRGIAHLGICPSVVMLDENWIVKLGGLGGIKFPHSNASGPDAPLHFCAPEMLQDKRQGCLASDVWSIGCILAELATRSALFHARDPADQLTMITTVDPLTNELAIFSRRFTSVSEETVKFLRACLQLDPRNRATVDELLKSNFLSPIAQACETTLATEADRVEKIWNDFGSRSNRLSGLFDDFTFKLRELGSEVIGLAAQEVSQVSSLTSEIAMERRKQAPAPLASVYHDYNQPEWHQSPPMQNMPYQPQSMPSYQPQMQSMPSYQPQMQSMPSYHQPQMQYQPHPPPPRPMQSSDYDDFRLDGGDDSSSVASHELYEVAKGLLSSNGSPAVKGFKDPKAKAKMDMLDDILEDRSFVQQNSVKKSSGADDVNLMQARQRRKEMIARQRAQQSGGGDVDHNPFSADLKMAKSEGSVLGRQQSVMRDNQSMAGGSRKLLDYTSTRTRETYESRRGSDVGSMSSASAAARAVAAIDKESSSGGLGNMRLPSIIPQKSSVGIVTALPVIRTASNVNFHSPQESRERQTLNHMPERTPSMMGSGVSFNSRQRASDMGHSGYMMAPGHHHSPLSMGSQPSFQGRRQASSMTGYDSPAPALTHQSSRLGVQYGGGAGGHSILGNVSVAEPTDRPSYFSQRGSNSILQQRL